MKKNLFEFATKELSQDAFLRWLLENYNDPIVGKASKKLLNAFIELDNSVDYHLDSIKSIVTLSQYKHIDIIADVELNNGNKFKFIIEDKTSSLPHDNQLNEYSKKIKDKDLKHIYKIYYKTDCIFRAELEEVKKSKWILFGIKNINSVFRDFIDSDDEILSSYAKYVNEKYLISTKVPSGSPTVWNFEEWAAYFEIGVEKLINEYFDNKLIMYNKIYRGKVICLRLYYKNRFYNKHQPLIEFAFEKTSNRVRTKIFVETEVSENKYSWKINKIDSNLLALIHKKFDNEESKLFRKLNRVEAISSKIKPLNKELGIESFEKDLLISCEYFIKFFDDIYSRINNPIS